MKLSAVFQTLAVASYATLGYATILLDRVPSNFSIGDTVKLHWSADHDYVSMASLSKTATNTIDGANIQSPRH